MLSGRARIIHPATMMFPAVVGPGMGWCEARATPESCHLTEEQSKEETKGHCDDGPSPVAVAREARVLSGWRQGEEEHGLHWVVRQVQFALMSDDHTDPT